MYGTHSESRHEVCPLIQTAIRRVVDSDVDEIGLAGAIQEFLRQHRWSVVVAGDANQRAQDVAWVNGAEFALRFDIVLAQEINETVLVEWDVQLLALAAEDFAIDLNGRVCDVDFVLNAPEECFIDEIFRREVGRKNDELVKWNFNLLARVQSHEVDPFFQWHDPAIEKLPRKNLLPTKVVNQQHATVGLDLKRRFVDPSEAIVDKIEHFQGQFAAGDQGWTFAENESSIPVGAP